MPSWPSRLLPGSFTPSSPPSAPDRARSDSSPNKKAHPKLDPDSPIFLHAVPVLQKQQQQQQQPSRSAAVPSTSSPTRQASRHGRSTSHPFISLFGSSKKVNKGAEGILNAAGLQMVEDRVVAAGNGILIDDPMMASCRGSPQYTEKDLVTGKCMTCDSNVRWPRHLDVFRCTVCLMINDLKPAIVVEQQQADTAQAGEAPTKADAYPRARTARKGKPRLDYIDTKHGTLTAG